MSTIPAAATQAQFAVIANVKPSYVTALKKAGRLVLDAEGRVLVRESLERMEATRDPAKAAVAARHAEARGAAMASPPAPATSVSAPPSGDGGGAISGGYQQARAVKEKFLALEAKRAYEVAIGKLVDADAVRLAASDAATRFRTTLEALPTTLGPQLAAEADEGRCVALMREAVELALGELARQFTLITEKRG